MDDREYEVVTKNEFSMEITPMWLGVISVWLILVTVAAVRIVFPVW